jgi:hypothetical protein
MWLTAFWPDRVAQCYLQLIGWQADRRIEERIVIRCRISLIVLLFLIALLGYWVRFDAPISAGSRDSLGGAAYVIFFVLAIAIIKPATPAARIALFVLGATCMLEFLQLWHPLWLENIRRTFAGRALLGTTFSWTDFQSYFAGALIGWILVRLHRRIWRMG